MLQTPSGPVSQRLFGRIAERWTEASARKGTPKEWTAAQVQRHFEKNGPGNSLHHTASEFRVPLPELAAYIDGRSWMEEAKPKKKPVEIDPGKVERFLPDEHAGEEVDACGDDLWDSIDDMVEAAAKDDPAPKGKGQAKRTRTPKEEKPAEAAAVDELWDLLDAPAKAPRKSRAKAKESAEAEPSALDLDGLASLMGTVDETDDLLALLEDEDAAPPSPALEALGGDKMAKLVGGLFGALGGKGDAADPAGLASLLEGFAGAADTQTKEN